MKDTISQKECMTIVVPVYNRPKLIVRCLESLKAQTYRPLHIIVVDNASTDDTMANIERWMHANADKDFSMDILSETNPGAAYARNLGLNHVATDKVMFFDSDDTMRPNCVKSIMELWRSYPDPDVIVWQVAIHQDSNVRITHSIKGCLIEQHLVHAILRTQGYAIKRDFIKKAGGWRGEFPVWNDLETGSRILLSNPKAKVLDGVYADVYHQKESITGENFSDKYGTWERSLDGIDESIRKSARNDMRRLHNVISYRRAILAAHYSKEGHPELAKPLFQQALSEVPMKKRPLIRFAYHWTKCGLRGAFSIIGKFL
ncbi:MAG: glycosyltransferase family 2 protein [Muribaculaceae bacterium]|nr:glycosyltransferase family 2 protein [Muribaculaceae bacterium]